MSNNDKGLRNALDLIQSLMTDHFIERLQSGEITPSELNTIRQFLKDNNIVVPVEKSADLGTLGAMLPEFTDEVEDDAIFN
jgi:hypothetical protein